MGGCRHRRRPGALHAPGPAANSRAPQPGPGTAATRLGGNGSQPEDLSEAAKQGLVRWQKFLVTDATPAQAKVARVVRRSYQLLWSSLQAAPQ